MPPEVPEVPNTDHPWILVLFLFVTLIGTVIGGAGGVEMIRAFTRRKPRRTVEITNQIDLAKQAQAYAQQLEEDARQARESEQKAWAEARRQSAAAWEQADKTQQKLVQVNRKLDETMYRLVEMGRYMETLVLKIYAPDAEITDVREWLRSVPPPTTNGHRPH